MSVEQKTNKATSTKVATTKSAPSKNARSAKVQTSKKVPSTKSPSKRAAKKKEASGKDASMNQAPQVSERFKALDLQRREGIERLLDLSWLRAADKPLSDKACLKLLADISARARAQAALELKCADASMKHGKRFANPKSGNPELAAALEERAGHHRQVAAALASMDQKFNAMRKALSKGDTAKFETLLKGAGAGIKH